MSIMKQIIPGNQRGSGIVMLLGIVATLAVLATSLVWIVGNMQHNSAQDRTRAKSFGVTEAALDTGMAALSAQWPAALGTGPDLGSTAEATFRAEFSSSEYPSPAAGTSFVTWQYYDNQDPIDPNITWDKGSPEQPDVPDNRVWLVVQSNVGAKSSRIQALVERAYLDTGLPRGVALFAGGNLLSNGGGNNPKIVIEVPPPSGIQTTVRVGGFIDDLSVSATNIVDLEGEAAGTVDEVFPESLREQLKAVAQANGRYFTSVDEAQNSPIDPNWSPQGGLSGLCVVEPSPTSTVTLRAGVWNSETEPGFLLVLGGGNIDFAGAGEYWGAMYTDGTVDKGHGAFIVHGMVVAAALVDMRGTVNIHYNDNVIARLANRWSLKVHLVPNTWRELQPVAGG